MTPTHRDVTRHARATGRSSTAEIEPAPLPTGPSRSGGSRPPGGQPCGTPTRCRTQHSQTNHSRTHHSGHHSGMPCAPFPQRSQSVMSFANLESPDRRPTRRAGFPPSGRSHPVARTADPARSIPRPELHWLLLLVLTLVSALYL